MINEPNSRGVFCFDMTRAAATMGIGLKQEGKKYTFHDPATGVVISGEENEEQRDALFSACEALSEYLTESGKL